MKFFTNKNIWAKIVIVLIFVLLFQFAIAKPIQAADSVDSIEFGGKLLSPILSLFVTLGDGVMGVLHSSIMGSDSALLRMDLGSTWLEFLGKALVWIFAAAVTAAAMFFTGGLIGPLLVGVVIGVYGSSVVSDATADKVSRSSYFVCRKVNSRNFIFNSIYDKSRGNIPRKNFNV